MAWLLPPEPATDYVCVKIDIPNTQQDIRNFIGSVLSLSQWFNYERTGTTLGSEVAQTWLVTLNNLLIGACMQVRQDPENPCMLQESNDGGESWTDWADITECVNASYIGSLITDNLSLQQLIANYSLESSIDPTTVENSSNGNTQIINAPSGCDNDNIYGMTLQLVEFINAVNEDILELFVNAVSSMARLGDIIEAIPVIGSLPADDAYQFVESFLDDINQAYESAFTESLKIELACDLFCIAQEQSCVLTMWDARNYFANRLSLSFQYDDVLTFITDLLVNNYLGSFTVDAMYLLFFQTLIFGGEMLGQNTDKLARALQAMVNDPDPDWETVCDECPEYFLYDWLDGNGNPESGNWEIVVGTYEASPERIIQEVTTSPSTLVYLRIYVPAGMTTTIQSFEAGYAKNTNAMRDTVVRIYDDLNVIVSQQVVSASGTTSGLMVLPDNVEMTEGYRMEFACATDGLPSTYFARLTSLHVAGFGDDIFA